MARASKPRAAKTKKMRVAVVGAGSMANYVHYPSLASFPDVETAGICDLSQQRLSETADKYGIEKRYSDYRKMVEELAPDAIYIIGHPDQMYPLWVWCLQQGLNLYIEKPMGITIHQARTLAYLADKHNCITQVSFQRRTCPMVVKLRNECLKRGPMVHAVCQFYKFEIKPYFEARDRMTDDGIHAIDTLRWMCGGEVEHIHSLTKRVQVPDTNFMAALLEFDNDATGVMLTSWSSGSRTFRVEMHAPGIRVDAEHEGKGRLYAKGDTKGVEYDTKEVAGSDEIWVYGGFQAKHREFIDCVKSGKQPGSNFSDALKTMEVAEEIMAMSLLEGR
jgi:predicted dehydrogenase